ncbi:transcriptional regulator, TetR family [Catenulispora acidiphila DSM 44928]|uniref:Transcriptional regulator, TetR family n=1 Tax=Catenulispora acidiphila (strain DSM 44928 / JCM 14897 / NBRC 102108 / NRRL B-24433 / ID139908) TaxID=479433 RepID=C7QDK7_CATAD|nr:TetR/AcrR family transcriptional regulator [Catenulispora acidiphila]ACU74631.1 transcriptional regulator, TetR family [Catenulispora acidiphila DSM 44928]
MTAHQRDAVATREAILAAAVVEFTAHGYAGAGVRQIAERAGVTAMMINRYFGSKQGLFAEAVDRSFGPATVVGSERRGLMRDMARALAERTAPGAEGLDPFLLMLRCASDPEAVEIVRRGVEAHAGARLAGLIGGDEADVRAQLGLALVAGTWLMRVVVGTGALAAADDARLAELLGAMLAPLTQEADTRRAGDADADATDADADADADAVT